MLTEEEKNIISLIAADLETGRHLIRQKSDWKRVLKSCGDNVKREDYDEIAKELIRAIGHFGWTSNGDKSNAREKEILIYFKASQDYDFYAGLKNCV